MRESVSADFRYRLTVMFVRQTVFAAEIEIGEIFIVLYGYFVSSVIEQSEVKHIFGQGFIIVYSLNRNIFGYVIRRLIPTFERKQAVVRGMRRMNGIEIRFTSVRNCKRFQYRIVGIHNGYGVTFNAERGGKREIAGNGRVEIILDVAVHPHQLITVFSVIGDFHGRAAFHNDFRNGCIAVFKQNAEIFRFFTATDA